MAMLRNTTEDVTQGYGPQNQNYSLDLKGSVIAEKETTAPNEFHQLMQSNENVGPMKHLKTTMILLRISIFFSKNNVCTLLINIPEITGSLCANTETFHVLTDIEIPTSTFCTVKQTRSSYSSR